MERNEQKNGKNKRRKTEECDKFDLFVFTN